MFDEYLENSKFQNPTNKKGIGKVKDETKDISFVEFVGLNTYS